MADPVAELVAASRYAGGDVLLAQGGGGNTSAKSADGARLWIKASGVKLAEVTESAGWLDLDLPALRRTLDDPALAALSPRAAHDESVQRIQAVAGGGALRPSLETSFHAALPQAVVLHTHAVYVNAFTCMAGGRAALGGAVPWVGYATPGLLLGQLVADAHRATGADRFALENHGLITAGADAVAAIAAHEEVVALGRAFFGDVPAGAADYAEPSPVAAAWAAELRRALGAGRCVRPAACGGLPTSGDGPPTGGALVPDDVVYNIHAIRCVDPTDVPDELPSQAVVWVRGGGFVLVGPSARNVDIIEENLLANVLLHALIARRGRPQYLPADEVGYLSGMESEKYRQRVAAGKAG